MITGQQARNMSEEIAEKNKMKKWNLFDTLQLTWFEMLIKRKTKKGRRKVISNFIARPNVQAILEKEGFRVWKENGLGTLIRW